MFASFLLSLREATEAALVVGVVLGVLRRLGRMDCARVIWVAVALSVGAALAFRALGLGAAASAEPVFEGTTLLGAAGLLTWMAFWMARQSRARCGDLKAKVTAAASCGSGGRAVFLLTFLAVGREGIELALFLTAVSLATDAPHVLAGAALGVGAAAALAGLVFVTSVRLDVRRFFQLTGVALILFAAGLVAKGLGEYNEAGWLPAPPRGNTHA